MDELVIAGQPLRSRLLIGTGKFSSPKQLRLALEASGADLITVALRRVDLNNPQDPMLSQIDTKHYRLLPNTSGARNADEAVRVARLGQALSGTNWVKLEVTPEPRHLLPDPIDTLRAAEQLVKDGFVVLPYIPADPVLAKRLEEIGTATVMPLGAPIGTNQGLLTKESIALIIEQSKVPVIVDAGIGAPSHAAEAMEMGADAVLVNTALAIAQHPARMSEAFKLAVLAGRTAYLAGLPEKSQSARASSPLTGFLRA